MERASFLVEKTNQRISCLLNPESVSLRRVSGIAQRESLGGALTGADLSDDNFIFTGGGRTEILLDLLFDVGLADTKSIVSDVRELTSPLWLLTENNSTDDSPGRPGRVRFVWGKSWNIPGVIAAISEHLDYFDSNGVPLRSWLRMRFLRTAEVPEVQEPRIPAIAPEVTGAVDRSPLNSFLRKSSDKEESKDVSTHKCVAGERLDQLVARRYGFYGHPALWRVVANYNNISDPLNIEAGTIIRFPALTNL